MAFLPATLSDLKRAGVQLGELDAIIVTGDAYVDHSSFGAAIIGRVLESEGYKVAILARPDPDDVEAFRLFGRPRLGFLVTAGAVDSMVSSYMANRKPRSEDEYAPGGDKALCLRADGSIGAGIRARPNARPDRAAIVYSAMCRQAYKGIPLIIGGIEASLRRLSHYDYWSDTVRKSILLDSKADVLVYGMGERQIAEIMGRLNAAPGGAAFKPDLTGIRGTVWAKHVGQMPPEALAAEFPDASILPGFDSLSGSDPEAKLSYAASFALQYRNTDPHSATRLVEPYGDRVVVQEPPAFPLDRKELDAVYALPYEREAHPMYETHGGVPALAEVKFSLLSARGCFGACSFCSLTFHQGRQVNSRSIDAIVEEARILTAMGDFKGYIHDVGGPTANFRRSACGKMEKHGACLDRRCLSPEPCANLEPDHKEYVRLLRALRSLPGVKKVFVRSGVRYDYAMADESDEFLRELVSHHISGQLKVAPEHVSDKVLALMGKPPRRVYDAFAARYATLNREKDLKQYLVPYFISAHPGSGLPEAIELAEYLRDTGFVPDQAQDFYPTPGTLATAMYWCGTNPLDGQPVYVARGAHERALQRALLQYNAPANADLVREALRISGREDLIGTGSRCLVKKR
ncbi:MAG: YgiQ family radical SAM protein [Spirochaetae bacterium HGW-Spirochaetae-9]|nr:MAG: YgiQ family radical SAM protein [Spirochaetae bacterium HGW-Spirochaetae-9]